MQVSEVLTKSDKREFIDFAKKLYRDDPFWVCQLDSDIESIFDPSRNKTFSRGEAVRWLLRDEEGNSIGRIAAFTDQLRSSANRQPTGGIGYFEVIDSREAAFTLFDTARDWLASRKMEAMDGPINFGENDTNWGLLVEGFMQPGFGMAYNKKYYRAFFEEYGFRNYFEQLSYHKEVRDSQGNIVLFPERIRKIAGWLVKRPGYTFRHFEMARVDKYISEIVEIYNSTWSLFKDDFTPLDPESMKESFKKAKPVIDEELIWFAYHNDRPISFFILAPDFNQILKHFNGRLTLWNIIRFIYYKLTHEMTRVRAIVGGVHPSYQNSGVESAIFLHIYEAFRKKPWFKELELSWVGDYNPKMMAIYEALGSAKVKTHITYRYLINKELPFVRFKDEMAEKHGNNHNQPAQAQ